MSVRGGVAMDRGLKILVQELMRRSLMAYPDN